MTHRGVDMVVAILIIALGGLVMYDSYQVGIGWESGPQSGYFPFYIGVLMTLASVVTLVQATVGGSTETFVDWLGKTEELHKGLMTDAGLVKK